MVILHSMPNVVFVGNLQPCSVEDFSKITRHILHESTLHMDALKQEFHCNVIAEFKTVSDKQMALPFIGGLAAEFSRNTCLEYAVQSVAEFSGLPFIYVRNSKSDPVFNVDTTIRIDQWPNAANHNRMNLEIRYVSSIYNDAVRGHRYLQYVTEPKKHSATVLAALLDVSVFGVGNSSTHEDSRGGRRVVDALRF